MDDEDKVQVDEEKEETPPRKVAGMSDIPEPSPRVFEFVQAGEKLALEYWPLTAQEVEAIRASIPEPEPPTRPVGGAKEIAHLRERGFPTTIKDTSDPVFLEAVRRRETDLGLEMVRVALRWGPAPSPEFPPDQLAQVRSAFADDVRVRLTAGNLANLINEVSNATFALDQRTLDRFFGPFAR